MENTVIKKEKIGSDGLSKKERRAMKVQTRGSTDLSTTGSENTHKEADTIPTVSPQKEDKEIKDSKQLTAKERRKLEWEKKVAEQKGKEAIDNKGELSKGELKAKRREKQEAQRLAKASVVPIEKAADQESGKDADVPVKPSKPQPISDAIPSKKRINKRVPSMRKSPFKTGFRRNIKPNKVQLVEHLYVEKTPQSDLISLIHNDIHPAFIKLGAQYANKNIIGSNARCLALLAALKHLINDIQTPPKQEFCRYLETVVKTNIDHLQKCRPSAVSMTNALRYFNLYLSQIDTSLEDHQKQLDLLATIDTYIKDDISKAGEAISLKVREKIANGDVILTYGCSSLITRILMEAHKDGKKFTVIVVDGRPLLEGREMLRRLAITGIKCRYIYINAIGYVMSSVTKVILGAHALLTNGYVMSRIGTAQVALVATAYNKPVLVCCETYKFSERVQTDSFVYNEIDKPEERKVGAKTVVSNALSNLLYDVTPPDFVTAVFTEKAIIPCTSVPVVLRINANEG